MNNESWNMTGEPIKPIDWEKAKATMEEVSDKMRDVPTVLVTLTKHVETLREMTKASGDHYVNSAIPRLFTSCPVEDYGTMRECLDRIVQAEKNGNPVLIANADDFTPDVSDHPYVRRSLVKQLESMFGFGTFTDR